MLREIESRLTYFETSELLTQAAAIYMDRGKRAKAQQFLERALEIATDEALRTRYLLGQLYLERNEPKKAWPLFDAVYRVDNTYQFGEIKLWAARTYLALQEPQVAETLADEFLQRERGHALALGIKGDALWAQSRYVDAKEVYRELLDGLANASGKNHDKYRDLERTARRRLAE